MAHDALCPLWAPMHPCGSPRTGAKSVQLILQRARFHLCYVRACVRGNRSATEECMPSIGYSCCIGSQTNSTVAALHTVMQYSVSPVPAAAGARTVWGPSSYSTCSGCCGCLCGHIEGLVVVVAAHAQGAQAARRPQNLLRMWALRRTAAAAVSSPAGGALRRRGSSRRVLWEQQEGYCGAAVSAR